MKECLGGIDWVFNPQHVWNVLNMEDRAKTEINKQLKCITNVLWPTLLSMQGWRAVVSNRKKKNPVLPVLELNTKYGPHFDPGFIPSNSIPDPTRDQGGVQRIYTNEPHQRSMEAGVQHFLLQQRRAENASTKGESHEIQISTSKMVKQHRKQYLKGKMARLVLMVKKQNKTVWLWRQTALGPYLSSSVTQYSPWVGRSLYLSKPRFPHL